MTEDHEVAGSNPAGGTILFINSEAGYTIDLTAEVIIMEEENLDEVLIDLRSTDLSMMEVLAHIDQYKQDPRYQNFEIFLDGDRYAIVARPKVR